MLPTPWAPACQKASVAPYVIWIRVHTANHVGSLQYWPPYRRTCRPNHQVCTIFSMDTRYVCTGQYWQSYQQSMHNAFHEPSHQGRQTLHVCHCMKCITWWLHDATCMIAWLHDRMIAWLHDCILHDCMIAWVALHELLSHLLHDLQRL